MTAQEELDRWVREHPGSDPSWAPKELRGAAWGEAGSPDYNYLVFKGVPGYQSTNPDIRYDMTDEERARFGVEYWAGTTLSPKEQADVEAIRRAAHGVQGPGDTGTVQVTASRAGRTTTLVEYPRATLDGQQLYDSEGAELVWIEGALAQDPNAGGHRRYSAGAVVIAGSTAYVWQGGTRFQAQDVVLPEVQGGGQAAGPGAVQTLAGSLSPSTLKAQLQTAGYPGPWDTASMVAAYNRAVISSAAGTGTQGGGSGSGSQVSALGTATKPAGPGLGEQLQAAIQANPIAAIGIGIFSLWALGGGLAGGRRR